MKTTTSAFGAFNGAKQKRPMTGVSVQAAFLRHTMMTYMEFEAAVIIPTHQHEHEQITLVLEGEMEMVVGGQTKVLRRGEWAAVPANESHSARVITRTVAVDAWSPIREDYVA